MKTSSSSGPTLSELTPDPNNANLGTDRGRDALAHSLQTYGAGRAVLIDRHGVIIAGNKTAEQAKVIGQSADAVVVGSAIVNLIASTLTKDGKATGDTVDSVATMVRGLSSGVKASRV